MFHGGCVPHQVVYGIQCLLCIPYIAVSSRPAGHMVGLEPVHPSKGIPA